MVRLASAAYKDYNVKLKDMLAVIDASDTVPDGQGMALTNSQETVIFHRLRCEDPVEEPTPGTFRVDRKRKG